MLDDFRRWMIDTSQSAYAQILTEVSFEIQELKRIKRFGNKIALRRSAHHGDLCCWRSAVADMQWAIRSIKIKPVKRSVRNNPLRDLKHVFIFNAEIDGSP